MSVKDKLKLSSPTEMGPYSAAECKLTVLTYAVRFVIRKRITDDQDQRAANANNVVSDYKYFADNIDNQVGGSLFLLLVNSFFLIFYFLLWRQTPQRDDLFCC